MRRSRKWRTMDKLRLIIKKLNVILFFKQAFFNAFYVRSVELSIGDYKRNDSLYPHETRHEMEKTNWVYKPSKIMYLYAILADLHSYINKIVLFIWYSYLVPNIMYYLADSCNTFLCYAPPCWLFVLFHECFMFLSFPFPTAFLPTAFPPQHFLPHYHRISFSSYWIYPLMFHIIRVLPQGSAICIFIKTIKDMITYLRIMRFLERWCQCKSHCNLIFGKTHLSIVTCNLI